jgi:hypothetical protein
MFVTLQNVSTRTTQLCASSADALNSTLRGSTRSVSSSPYGRTHVWKHRQRKLPNPVVPQFPQTVIRSDGSSFVHHTTSPRSLIRLTRDVTNAPLWNIELLSSEGAQEESASSGRLGRFNRRFADDINLDWMADAESAKEVNEAGKDTKEKP